MFKKITPVSIFLLLALLTLAACQTATPTPTQAPVSEPTQAPVTEPTQPPATEEMALTPSVTVADQEIKDGKVIIAEVVSAGPGWLVVHAQADGKPGPILGYAPVSEGVNKDVVVDIDPASATETLYAMLHVDAGTQGEFEFPNGDDGPVSVDGKVVTPPFKVMTMSEGSSSMGGEEGEPIIMLAESETVGKYLTDASGMALYIFANDGIGVSNCYEVCAENWPPFLLEEGMALVAGEGINGELGTIERTDGGTQVTYNGLPLYYWINDAAPGETTGHGVRSVWAVASLESALFRIQPGDSKITYEVAEVFLQNNQFNVAVGVTDQVEGTIMFDPTNPLSAVVGPLNIDISQFTSDSERRDNKIRSDFLESAKFPIATFVPTSISGLPTEYSPGEEINLQISGDLTVKEVTQPVTFEVTVRYSEGSITGTATTTILMSDFGVGPISILGILETEDEVKLTFDFVASK